MAHLLTRYDRRDEADRDALARAALDLCRATRAQDGITSSRFYWVNADTVVVLSEAESMEKFDGAGSADAAKAIFAISDLARATGTERWIDPRTGAEAYRLAGQ